MLKIKDNVDLKELEKFGFKRTNKDWAEFAVYTYTKKGEEFRDVWVYGFNMQVECDRDGLDILFDLIQAGLVEKVEEQE